MRHLDQSKYAQVGDPGPIGGGASKELLSNQQGRSLRDV